MATKVWLVSHAANADLRAGVFASAAREGDEIEALDARAVDAVEAWRARWLANIVDQGVASRALTSPASVARASAKAAGFDARVEGALAQADSGAWAGCRLNDIARDAPAALAAWTRDPAFRPPGGGESFEDVRERVSAWLDAVADDNDAVNAAVIAFTHADVIRAAVLHALGAPSAAFRHIEIAPLSVTALRRSARGWAWVAATV